MSKHVTETPSPLDTAWLSTHGTRGVKINRVNTSTDAQNVRDGIPFSTLAIPKTTTPPSRPAISPNSRTHEANLNTRGNEYLSPNEKTGRPICPQRSNSTPVKPERLLYHLEKINYDVKITKYLIDGFTFGFSLGHHITIDNIEAVNSKNVIQNEDIVTKKLQKEMDAGRIKGPFDEPPFSPFHISPLNIREKKTSNKFRLLHNLSHPHDGRSINANIPDNLKKVKYANIGDAIHKLLQLPKNSFSAKTDISDAFRLIPIHPSDHPKLGIQFKGKYYFDCNLPQGCGSSCQIFETFSTAIHKIFEWYVPGVQCVHMLDDYFIMAADYNTCKEHLTTLLEICKDIGVPMAPEKTTEPNISTTFLGIELDSNLRQAKLPLDKLNQYSGDIQELMRHSKIKKRLLESLIGKLNFASSVVPARPFLRRLINLLSTVKKPYHYIRLTNETKEDLFTWLSFLTSYNGVTFFRALQIAQSPLIHMVSDASKMGFGACYGKQWIQAEYPEEWQSYHITILELYPIHVLINLFGHLMKNSSILFHCDNSAVTAIINKQSSRNNIVMKIVRPLVLLLINHNIQLRSVHIPGVMNILPDKISRFQVTPSLLQEYGMEPHPTPIPHQLLPVNFTIN